jgi:radial spoke head protein 9
LQYDAAAGTVTLRSLLWPGYFFFHVAGTGRFGAAYFGAGEKNVDISFMLPPRQASA